MIDQVHEIIAGVESSFFIITATGVVTFASRGMYSVPAGVFLERGIDAFDLLLSDHERLHFAQMLTTVLEGKSEVASEIFQANVVDRNGDPVFFSVTAKALPEHGPERFLFEVHDRTQFIRKEQEMARLQREVLIFKEISSLRQLYTDADRFFDAALQQVVETVDADAALLYVAADSREELLVHNNVVPSSSSVPSLYLHLPRAVHLLARVSLIRSDAATFDRHTALFAKKGWMTTLILPLQLRSERVGTLILLSKQDDAFPWHAIRLAASIASFLGAFVATELLWRQKERLTALTKSVFAYSPDGLFIIDRDGRVGERNALTERIMGTDEGVLLETLVIDKQRRRVKEFTRQLRLHRTVGVAVVFRADPVHTYEISATPLATGELVQYLCMARNVTGWVDERSALQQRNDQLAMVDRMKDEFVSMVSHELRSPLTVVMGNLSLLEMQARAKDRPLLTDMRRNIDRLNRLVRDILEATRLEYADIPFDSTTVELAAITEVVESAVHDEVMRRQLIWKTAIPSESVQNDPVRLTQIVTNLVSNSVRHTPSGGTVSLTMKVADDWLTITVTDTGEGMTDEQQEHIFERFYRGQHTTAGFGLGLYIVKKLLERMGGRVTVQSAVNKGTMIIVQIPRVV